MHPAVTQSQSRPQVRDIAYCQADFERISAILQRISGITMPATNEALVYSRLAKRVRGLGLDGFAEYIDRIQKPDSRGELDVMVAALTTNTTRFFREEYHFETFANEVLPGLAEAAIRGARIRLWSAACSSGEEAYSLAAVVLRDFPEAPKHDFRILATDINRDILATATEGRFPRAACASVPAEFADHMFEAPGADGDRSIRRPLRDLVTFRYMNFMEPWPVRGPFAAIFCRNVMIYMDEPTQARIWAALAGVLSPGGYLFIGHSERIGPEFRDRLELVGKTTFRRL